MHAKKDQSVQAPESKEEVSDVEDFIIVFWDVDDTLINPKSLPKSLANNFAAIDFNGSLPFWESSMSALQTTCQAKKVKLINMLLSAKLNAVTDATVIVISDFLKNFLIPVDKKGRPQPLPKGQIGYRRYYLNQETEMCSKTAYRVEELLFNDEKLNRPEILNPIHLVYANIPGSAPLSRYTSKAKAMHYVQHFFSDPLPKENLILIDNSLTYLKQVQDCGYQTVSAEKMNALTNPLFKDQRTAVTKEIFANLKQLIDQRLEHLVSARQNRAKPPEEKTAGLDLGIQVLGSAQTAPLESPGAVPKTKESPKSSIYRDNPQPLFATTDLTPVQSTSSTAPDNSNSELASFSYGR